MRYLIIVLCLSGCVGQQIVTLPNNEVYTAEMDTDTVVSIVKPDGTQVTFDRRGNAGVMENLLTFLGLKMMDTTPTVEN